MAEVERQRTAEEGATYTSVAADIDAPRFGYRWIVLAMLFFATTINYVDRQVLGILAPQLQREIGWTETDYGAIVSWFSLTYAFGLLVMGRVLDRVGARVGFALSIIVWSVAAMGHALARTVTGFGFARAMLGIGESGNFPAAIKTVSNWFPKRERALAVGIFNAGSNVGALLAPLIVVFITTRWGWRAAFITTGAIGFVWLALWLTIYREPETHSKVTRRELEYIRSDPADPATRVPWLSLLAHRQTWAFFLGKALTDPVWFFYLFWLPKFLDAKWQVKLTALAAPLVAIYIVADFGSVAGGWMSSALIKRGWSVNRARKITMFVAALAIVPTMFAPSTSGLWTAVAMVSIAAAAHQWWSCNLYTIVSDMFPRRAVASVIGIGGFAGAFAAFGFQRATGRILDVTHGNYQVVFYFLGGAYLVALLVIQLLVPRLEAAQLEVRRS